MESKQIRKAFLDFFESKKHQIVPSAPIVVKNDPTLMFTNAGMNQFKDYFLGNQVPKFTRIADTQKCLRVSGKHNDLEEVGIDTYHHTMFEMLGNWSFGDYFKEDALKWSWELLTEVYKLPKDRIYVTVFGGDASENLQRDDEALAIWSKYIDKERILYGSKKDNFWEMGDTGPCGPCSEIHIDLRSEEDIKKKPGKELVNESHPLVIEIWNNVFIQYNRLANKSLDLLPAKHVDTGMGFERLCMAIQKKTSNYDTDVFQPLIQFIAKESGIKYGEKEQTDIAMRVLSDHIRAISFTIADGQLPSNTGAGYVIRRILRRAVRYQYTFLGLKEPFLHKLLPILADIFDGVFPELKAQEAFIMKVIQEEEISFLRTLEIGLKKLEEGTKDSQNVTAFDQSKADELVDNYLGEDKKHLVIPVKDIKGVISGELAFELYDTFGFPLDLTELIARENGNIVNVVEFKKHMEQQKERSRKAGKVAAGDWTVIGDTTAVEFVGYDSLTSKARIVEYRSIKAKDKEQYQIVLDKTPFYAESGGQVGDTGYLINGKDKIKVLDTKKENGLIVHFTDKLPAEVGVEFDAIVDERKRKLTENNHSATHLLHAALKQVLGTHVNQKGSLVNEKLLRFDFSHFSKMTDEEIQKVEKIVNEKIRENIALTILNNVPLEEAKNLGAMALFGEKYGEFVRVVIFDKNYSIELCGGTHVPASGQIGLFKIVSESSVAAGVRRIEAVTSEEAENHINSKLQLLAQLNEVLKSPADVVKSVEALVAENTRLQNTIEELGNKQAQELKKELLNKVETVDNVNYIIEKIDISSADALKNISFQLKEQVDNLFFLAAASIEGKPMISVMISENLVKEKGLHAGNLVKALAKEIQGGGGGQPFYATAGGKDVNGLDKVVKKAKESLFHKA